ncbi:MAG TPA: hypothetical protein PKL31_16275 [Fulvivirga sp.]|nr:hypothetical protein [Fulvivirga sp.]
MASQELIKQLTDLADRNPDDLYELSISAVEDHPEFKAHLQDAQRKLLLAKNRELMDDFQIKLAFRLTVRNLVKGIIEKENKKKKGK